MSHAGVRVWGGPGVLPPPSLHGAVRDPFASLVLQDPSNYRAHQPPPHPRLRIMGFGVGRL